MNLPAYSKFIAYWELDTSVVFLNHGSFGACPSFILKEQNNLQKRLEKQPLRFMMREYEGLLNTSKSRLAEFVGTDSKNIAYVNNATTGVNTVLRSINFRTGDEVVITNHIYPACKNALDYLSKTQKIKILEASIPFPLTNKQEILDAIDSKLSDKTRLLLIDHIASATSLVFPVKDIIELCHQKNIEVLIDGAHAPGTVELNLDLLNVDYYTGNCHKWLCSPKGSAFLFINQARQNAVYPLSVSLFYGEDVSFEKRFSWQGTDDPSAFLCVGKAIDFMNGIFPGGWQALRKSNHEIAMNARKLLCNVLQIAPPAPDELYTNLVSFPLPDAIEKNKQNPNMDILYEQLYRDYKIEVFVANWPEFPKRVLRISPQIYNSMEQYEYLAEALKKLL